jgi:cell division protein FtsW
MTKHSPPDFILLTVSGILVVLGILVLASVSPFFSLQKSNTAYYFLLHQIGWGVVPGIILGFVFSRLNPGLLKKLAPFLLFLNLIAMGLVFLPVLGITFRGATRWLSLGLISFQPSEFLKLTFILYLAAWLDHRCSLKKAPLPALSCGWQPKAAKKNTHFQGTLLAFLLVVGIVSLFLVFQRDISTLGVILFAAVVIYFAAETPFWQTISITSLIIVCLGLTIRYAPYRLNRLKVLLNPAADPMGIGYQINQALIGIGSGGIVGLGLGMSQQKFGFLPFPMSDSVFAVFAEETGFLGALFLISLFLLFLWRGCKIAKKSRDMFCRLSALGITSWLGLQAFMNIGAMLGILPLAGVPLPFLSYGGSALIAELVGVGILLNISKQKQ